MANKNYKHINLRFSAISEIKDQINLISEVREVLLYDRQTDRQMDGQTLVILESLLHLKRWFFSNGVVSVSMGWKGLVWVGIGWYGLVWVNWGWYGLV